MTTPENQYASASEPPAYRGPENPVIITDDRGHVLSRLCEVIAPKEPQQLKVQSAARKTRDEWWRKYTY